MIAFRVVEHLPDPDFDETVLLKNLGKAFLKSGTKMRWPLELRGGVLTLACIITSGMATALPDRLQKAMEKSVKAWLRWKKRKAGP
jgi:hypothetical protein